MSENKPKQTRKSVTLQEKVDIIKSIENGKTHSLVAREKEITRQCVSQILTKRTEILKKFEDGNPDRKKERPCKFSRIDTALLEWFKSNRNANIPLGGAILLEKAKYFAESFSISDFNASAGWLDKWKKRHGITFRVVSGEAAAVNIEDVNKWFSQKWTTIAGQYSPKDVYNCDETGLFWRTLPDKTHAFKNETCSGGKLSKERITVLLACNMNGTDKLQPLIIGKSARPRAFKRLHANQALPVTYRANKTAWMTSALFVEWLEQVDKEMRRQRRHVLLLLDNCPSYPHVVPSLKNIRLLFLPPNATSVCQPLDQGIIQNFKLKYRGMLLRKVINQLEASTSTGGWKIDVLDAILLTSSAWTQVSSECIANCFKKSGFLPQEQDLPDIELSETLPLGAFAAAAGIQVPENPDDYLAIDDLLATSEIPSNDEIVNSNRVIENEVETPMDVEGSDSEDDVSIIYDEPRSISKRDFLQSLNTAKSYLLQQPDPNYEEINFIMMMEDRVSLNLENSRRQSLLTDYFSS